MLTKCQACQHETSSAATVCPNCGHPNKPANGNSRRFGCASLILWGCGALAALAILGSIVPQEKKATQAASNSMLDDKDFLANNPGFPDGIRALIRLDGFECPALAELWMKGESAYGPELEALCGPNNGKRDAYPALHFLVYPKQAKVQLCKPFGPLGGGCG